ncbi:hypothetical protein GCM10027416_18970 [Okibacterium endophyticum]
MTTNDVREDREIIARVKDDLTAVVDIAGTEQLLSADDPERLRARVVQLVAREAEARGRALQVVLYENSERWPLLVHPDGRVDEVTVGIPAAAAPAAPAPAAAAASTAAVPPPPPPAAAAAADSAGEPLPAAAPVPVAPEPVAPGPVAPEPAVPAYRPAQASVGPNGQALPTLDDLLRSRPQVASGPAKMGWQGSIHRMTGGAISPRPGKAERSRRETIENVQKIFAGPRTIVIVNPKGGAHKTTATVLLSATFGTYRGGSTLAWDNNETRGTLGWRAQSAHHHRTAVDLLNDLDRFADARRARVGDLDNYVRAQADSQFDVLASDEDAAASSTIDAAAFNRLHATLSRFYRLIVIDTGNNMRASNWEAAIEAADQLVIVSTVREDTAASAAWLLDGLREKGYGDKVAHAVTVLASPSKKSDEALQRRLMTHFRALTRDVVAVPYDSSLVDGGAVNMEALSPETREAWLKVAGSIAAGL